MRALAVLCSDDHVHLQCSVRTARSADGTIWVNTRAFRDDSLCPNQAIFQSFFSRGFSRVPDDLRSGAQPERARRPAGRTARTIWCRERDPHKRDAVLLFSIAQQKNSPPLCLLARLLLLFSCNNRQVRAAAAITAVQYVS